jgi:cytochrome oxidase Cu insertion factor (SCO1/SenC/PrrC family)
MSRLWTLALLPVVAVLAVACGASTPAATPATTPLAVTLEPVPSAAPDTSTEPGAASTPESTPAGPPAAAGPTEAALEPWRTAPLTDVRSGETFTLADLAGRVVVIEPMAIWCVNCLRQQREVATALKALERDDVVYISLDVDPSERPSDLAAYAEEHGFDWRFVVAGRDVSRQLARDLGDQVLSPPSTPRIIVTPDGRVVGPTFGIADAAAVEAEIRSHLS